VNDDYDVKRASTPFYPLETIYITEVKRETLNQGSVYNKDIACAIVEMYLAGFSLQQVAKQPGMPRYQIILRWIKAHEEFRRMFEEARSIRAIHYEEKIIELVDKEKVSKQEVPWKKTQIDAYKYLASVASPESHGNRMTHDAASGSGLTLNVVTNVPDRAEVKVKQKKEEKLDKKNISKVKEEKKDIEDVEFKVLDPYEKKKNE